MADNLSTQKVWTLTAVQDWACGELPDALATLPDVRNVEFVDLDYNTMRQFVFRLYPHTPMKVLCIGLYDDMSDDPKDRVFAFLHGEQCNQVGYVVERTSPNQHYHKLNLASIRDVDIEEPFCNISDGNELQATTMTRLRALVCYCFLAAGHITQFGGSGFTVFEREFRKACLWIANGGSKPSNLRPQPRSHSLRSESPAAGTRARSESDTVFAKVEGLADFQSDDEAARVSRGACRCSNGIYSVYPLTDYCTPAFPHHLPSADFPPTQPEQDIPSDSTTFGALLSRVNTAYTTLENGTKRLKLSLRETHAKDASTITTLRAELAALTSQNRDLALHDTNLQDSLAELSTDIAALQAQLQDKQANYDTLVKLYRILKLRVASAQESAGRAERRAKEAEGTADERYAIARALLETQVRKERRRADAAEAELRELRGERLLAQVWHGALEGEHPFDAAGRKVDGGRGAVKYRG
jgi:regulator of replication initiation timing